jgi:ubiquinone/menaquinone biosynthesis C-methylase UbiE
VHEVAHRYAKKNPSACPSFLSFELFFLELPIIRSWLGGKAIVSRMGAQPGMSILEIGCGPGRITVPLAKGVAPGGRVVAVDMQEGMLEKLRKRLAKERIQNVEARQGTLGFGNFAAGDAFDKCVLVAVLGEIPDKLAALREVFSSLKPGGMLSVTEMKPDPHFQTEETVSSLAKLTGFEVNDTHRNRFGFTMNCRKTASNKTAGGDA